LTGLLLLVTAVGGPRQGALSCKGQIQASHEGNRKKHMQRI